MSSCLRFISFSSYNLIGPADHKLQPARVSKNTTHRQAGQTFCGAHMARNRLSFCSKIMA